MTKKNCIKPIAAIIGAALVGNLSAVNVVSAAENPFGASQIESDYMVVAGMDEKEGKCGDDMKKGEGKCGDDMKKGEGKCGDDMKKGEATEQDGKCGNGKCGGEK